MEKKYHPKDKIHKQMQLQLGVNKRPSRTKKQRDESLLGPERKVKCDKDVT